MSDNDNTPQVTWAALQAVHAVVLAPAMADVQSSPEQIAPQLFFFNVDPKTGQLENFYALSEELVGQFFNSTRGKDVLATLIKDTLTPDSLAHNVFVASHKFTPNCIVQVNEAWATQVPANFDRATTPPPSEHPDRYDVLLLALHTAQHTVPVLHRITRAADGTRTVEQQLFPSEDAVLNYRGRFTRQSAYTEDSGLRH